MGFLRFYSLFPGLAPPPSPLCLPLLQVAAQEPVLILHLYPAVGKRPLPHWASSPVQDTAQTAAHIHHCSVGQCRSSHLAHYLLLSYSSSVPHSCTPMRVSPLAQLLNPSVDIALLPLYHHPSVFVPPLSYPLHTRIGQNHRDW